MRIRKSSRDAEGLSELFARQCAKPDQARGKETDAGGKGNVAWGWCGVLIVDIGQRQAATAKIVVPERCIAGTACKKQTKAHKSGVDEGRKSKHRIQIESREVKVFHASGACEVRSDVSHAEPDGAPCRGVFGTDGAIKVKNDIGQGSRSAVEIREIQKLLRPARILIKRLTFKEKTLA